MKLTVVTAVFNAIKSGNRENLIRCVRSVAALKTEHEHLIYDGGSTDGTVELLRELEREGQRLDRRACAEKKVEEWLAGVDEATFDAALEKLVEEKSAAGEYVFENPADIETAIVSAKEYFVNYSRRIVELSDGRYVYFAPDARSKLRNAENSTCWAEYAFHAVSSGGDVIPGKNYTYRKYNAYKVVNADLIETTLREERCVPVLKNKPTQDAVKFFGEAHLGGLFDVVVRLDEYGNANANMTEVTFEASTKRKQKKSPQFVSLTEAIRTVVSHQTATGTYPPDESSIPFCADENKGGWLNSHSCLRVVSEPDTGIYNALNKGVRDAQGEWFYVLGCDDYICAPKVMDELIANEQTETMVIAATVERAGDGCSFFKSTKDLAYIFELTPCCHQGEIVRTDLMRRLNGFDESYTIAADADFFFKAHLAGAKFHYFYTSFAFYSSGGVSESRGQVAIDEFFDCIAKNLSFSEKERNDFPCSRILPFRKTILLLFHSDLAIRLGSRMMMKRWVAQTHIGHLLLRVNRVFGGRK